MSETVTPPDRQQDEAETDATAEVRLPQQRNAEDPVRVEPQRWRFTSAVQAARALRGL